jgi:hypothetical protein
MKKRLRGQVNEAGGPTGAAQLWTPRGGGTTTKKQKKCLETSHHTTLPIRQW